MPTPPTPITPYATPPSSSDPANFDVRADAKVADDQAKVAEFTALGQNAYDNAVEAAEAAAAALAERQLAEAAQLGASVSATQSAANAGATQWVSGTNYPTAGQRVWSPINQQLYSRVVAGAGTTDPSLDAANWRRVRIEADLQTARAYFLI